MSERRCCPSELPKKDYIKLAKLAQKHPEITEILNANGHASWTGCPWCRVDDFTHVEGCPMIEKVEGKPKPRKRLPKTDIGDAVAMKAMLTGCIIRV